MHSIEFPSDLGKVIIISNFLFCDIWPSEIKQTEISKCQSIKVFNKQKAQPKCLLYSGNVPYTMKLTRQPAIVALIAGFRMEAYFFAIKSL